MMTSTSLLCMDRPLTRLVSRGSVLASLALALLLLPLNAAAELRDYTVRWNPSTSSGVDGYELSVGTNSGDYSLTFDLGHPSEQTGVMSFPMELEGSVDLFLSLRAYGDGAYSPHSNEIVVAKAVVTPPPPPTDGGGGGDDTPPTFGVTSISGIPAVVSGEIVVVAQADARTSSVKFFIDGAPHRIENVVPYALEGDSGIGSERPFDTTTLSEGSHTIAATGYAGNNGSGEAGFTKSVTFYVDNTDYDPPVTDGGGDDNPGPDPMPDPDPSFGPGAAVAGLYGTPNGDIVALHVGGEETVLTNHANAALGTLRPSWCDLDGDSVRDIVVGFASGGQSQILLLYMDDLSVRDERIVTVGWPSYSERNGETFPACGDVDGDGRNEIVVGLGRGSVASAVYLDDHEANYQKVHSRAYTHMCSGATFGQLGLPYIMNGSAKPKVGDIDGDGIDEVVIARGDGGKSVVTVCDDANTGFAVLDDMSSSKGVFSAIPDAGSNPSGSTEIALGDIDADGIDELLVGTGQGGDGRLYIFDDANHAFAPIAGTEGGLVLGAPSLTSASGAIVPSVADIDGDGLLEVAVGFGEGAEGYVQVLDDLLTGFAPMGATGAADGIVAGQAGSGVIAPALDQPL